MQHVSFLAGLLAFDAIFLAAPISSFFLLLFSPPFPLPTVSVETPCSSKELTGPHALASRGNHFFLFFFR